MITETAKRKQAPEARPSQIVAGALRVFSRRGVQCASVEEIAAEAGVSKGLMYLYFKGKDALIEAVMQRLFAPDLKRAQRLIEAPGGARERLLEYARTIAVDAERYHKLLPLLFEYYSMLGRNKKLRAITANYYRQQEDLLRRLVQQGMKSGEFSDAVDPETVAVSLLALQEGFILRWMMEPDTTDWPAQAEQAVNLQLSSITVKTESCV
jgi:AcrR family transcriptional regulator